MSGIKLNLKKVIDAFDGKSGTGYFSETGEFSLSAVTGVANVTCSVLSEGIATYMYTSVNAADNMFSEMDASASTSKENWYIEDFFTPIVKGGAGNDSIGTLAKDVLIYGGAGDDVLGCYASASGVTIDGGFGNDTIRNYAEQGILDGGTGDDLIDAWGEQGSIDGGAGNDTIWIYSGGNKVVSSSGQDTVRVFGGANNIVDAGSNRSGLTVSLTQLQKDAIANNYIKGSDYGNNSLSDATNGEYQDEQGMSHPVYAEGNTLIGGSGQDTITVYSNNGYGYGDSGNDRMSVDNSTASVYGGDGRDYIEDFAGTAYGEDGDDTLVAGSDTGDNKITLCGGEGNDVFDLSYRAESGYNVTAIISDYAYGNDTLLIENLEHTLFKSSGAVTSGNNVTSEPVSVSSYYQATVETIAGGTKTDVWYTGTDASNMDATSSTAAIYMVSDNNDVGDTVLGGAGADSIYAGEGDYVYGGIGNDSINVTSNASVVLDGEGGTDMVAGFGTGNNTLYINDKALGDLAATNDGTNVAIMDGSASVILKDTGSTAGILIEDSSKKTYNAAIAQDNKYSQLAMNDEPMCYVGTRSEKYYTTLAADLGVSGSAENPRLIDLSNGMQGNFGSTSLYYNINHLAVTDSVTGSYGKIIGSTGSDAIAFSSLSGTDTIWGGTGDDTINLVTGHTGTAEVAFADGDGSDLVKGFKAATDCINIVTNDLASWKRISSGNIALTLDDASQIVVAGSNSVNDEITIKSGAATYVAKLGEEGRKNYFTTSANTGYYYGNNLTDTLAVSKTAEDTAIWLDNRKAKGTADNPRYSSIERVDGSLAAGNLLIGGAENLNESFVGGQGDTTLWGGVGGDDTLKGGTGVTAYLFGVDEGHDVILNTKSTDKVMLYSVSDADVASSLLIGNTMLITLMSGDQLSIQGMNSSSVNTFVLMDGTYIYDYSQRNTDMKGWTWKAKV